MSELSGLRRVLELVGPTIRASVSSGSFVPSTYATPLAIAALSLEVPFTVAVTATSSDAEHVRDALVAWLGERDVALWPGWDTHPLERVSPDSQVMALRALLRWQIQQGSGPRVVVASARSIAQVLSPEPLRPPYVFTRGSEINRDEFVAGLVAMGYRREHLVEHRAEIAVRGGIVDVWPAQNDEPLRLDFFGDEIERLTVFDIAT
ncbi:MAG TPA: transcription-repair coupling factor, partial [Acidimicrobiales bacterium]|nr:transcription-repair coupling factor [Acidimicrobiales bacterium]